MALVNRPAPVPPFFPSPLKGERGISGPARPVSGNFGEFRGSAPTAPHCRTCAHLARPGRAAGYCGADRPDLLPAYGPHHPLRRLPADQGKACRVWRLHPGLAP